MFFCTQGCPSRSQKPCASLSIHKTVDNPQARVCTGSYSYVAVGASGRTYDQLAAPVRRRLLFAGEHTCKVRTSCCTELPAQIDTYLLVASALAVVVAMQGLALWAPA